MRILAVLPLALASLGCANEIISDETAGEAEDRVPAGCGELRTMAVKGTVDGTPVQIDAPVSGVATTAGMVAFAPTAGENTIFTARSFFPDGEPDPPTFLNGSARSAVVTIEPASAGAGGPLAGICAAGDPLVTFNDIVVGGVAGVSATTELASLRNLGICPGAPVDAKLQIVCPDNPADAPWLLTGTVGGSSFQADQTRFIFGLDGPLDGTTAGMFFEGGGFVQVEPDGSVGGILVMPAGSPDPGAVYCVGGSANLNSGDPVTVLDNLSRLGTCGDAPPVSGSLSICTVFRAY